MFLNYRFYISLFSFLLCGLFSVNSLASSCSSTLSQCTATVSVQNPAGVCFMLTTSSVGFYRVTAPSVSYTYSTCTPDAAPPPCPSAGTPYTGYYPSQGAATNTVYAPNGSTATCAVNIDTSKSSCPPNTMMPTFGTVETPACIIVGTYTGSAGPSGAQSNTAVPPASSSDCPTGTGSYSITNGTSTVTGCGVTSKATTSNQSATPANTTATGSSTTSTTNTTVNENTKTNADGSTTTTGTTNSTNNSACGGAGQPACNVNSTCGGAGQPTCNSNIGDSTFTVATPSLNTPILNDKAQGTVSDVYSITNYTNASASGCPLVDQSASVFGYSITIPFTQICQYMDWVHYIVIVAASIAAMKLL
jgi:hypothetical protein